MIAYENGLREFAQGNYDRARSSIEAAIKQRPNSSRYLRTSGMFGQSYYPYYYLGRIALAKGELKESLQLFNREERQGEITKDKAMYAELKQQVALAETRKDVVAPVVDPPAKLTGDARRQFIQSASEEMLRRLGQLPGTPIPDTFRRQVESQVNYLTGSYKKRFQEALDRGRPLFDEVRRVLLRYKLPESLCYLPLIESEYQLAVKSPVGATGLWQLMPGTAKDLGLTVTEARDDRTDPRRSTDAAARYINGLIFEFGADGLMLAVASYNKGPGGIRSALRKLEDPFSQRNFWSLVEKKLIPKETVDYVPRFLAAAVIAEHQVAFGFPKR